MGLRVFGVWGCIGFRVYGVRGLRFRGLGFRGFRGLLGVGFRGRNSNAAARASKLKRSQRPRTLETQQLHSIPP